MSATDFNPYRAAVGDTVQVTLDTGETYAMTIYAVHPAGSGGTSHASGPQVMAWIRPGGFGVTLSSHNVARVELVK